jgi:SAM-dependent methyltransferase
MSVVDAVMSSPIVYQLWQAPFADRKLRPFLTVWPRGTPCRVLDVACGPGTNAKYFTDADYVGIDINEGYVRYARRRYGRTFLVGDVVTSQLPGLASYDCILVNSFLHHLDDHAVHSVLTKLRGRLARKGVIHLLELVLPDRGGPARWLARWDRGKHARSLAAWRELFAGAFLLDAFEPYSLGAPGIPLWQMVYARGRLP